MISRQLTPEDALSDTSVDYFVRTIGECLIGLERYGEFEKHKERYPQYDWGAVVQEEKELKKKRERGGKRDGT